MTGEEIVKLAMAKRTAAGLKLVFQVPDRAEPFDCYPKDEAQKAAWLANSAGKGWTLIHGA